MRNNLVAFLLIFLVSGTVYSQGNGNSVYSRFGIGDPVDDEFLHLRSMGYLGAAYNDLYHINIANPASLGFLRAVAFDVGVTIKSSQLNDGTTSQGIQSGNLEYLSLALPLNNKVNQILEREERETNVAMAFSLLPHSRVSYDITNLQETAEFGEIARNFTGEGGAYKFIWSNAIRHKNFGVGLNLGYLFGNIKYSTRTFFDPLEYAFENEFSTSYSLSGFLWRLGVQYAPVLNAQDLRDGKTTKSKRLTLGAYINSNNGFGTSADFLNLARQNNPGFEAVNDTLSVIFGQEGDGTLPASFGLGAAYEVGDKFLIGFDFEHTRWSAFRNEVNPDQLQNTTSYGIGGFYRPNFLSQSNYWDRVYYRYGLYYKQDPRILDQGNLDSYGVSIGLGLPYVYQRRISHANLGIEYGRRGSDALVSESFIRFNIGFTFNDTEWFLKRRYD